MKKPILNLLFAITFCSSLFSQNPTFTWAKQMGSTSNDAGNSIAVDATGNVFTTGFFVGTADFDPNPFATYTLISTAGSGGDIFVSKLNASGNFIWAKKMGNFGGNGNGIVLDPSGNVYTTGFFYTGGDFDPGPGVFTLNSFGGSDVFISKLDATGNFVWAKQIGGFGNEQALSISLDASGNVYTTGTFLGTVDFDPGAGVFNLTSPAGGAVFISKLDVSGNFVWAKQMGGASGISGNSVFADAAGNVYSTGYFTGTADFDPGFTIANLTSLGSADIFISKLDASGNFVFAKQMGGIGNDQGFSIALDGTGNIYSTGFFSGAADFNPGAGTNNLNSVGGTNDIYVSKLDLSGNFVWAKAMGGNSTDNGQSISLDGTGNVYTTGKYRSNSDFDPGAGIFNLVAQGVDDMFISKLDGSGNFVWAGSMGGTGLESGNSITLDASGNIYSTGYFSANNVDLDPTVGVFQLSSAGQSDILVHKLSQCLVPAQPGPISGNLAVCSGINQIYFVSPVAGTTSYNWVLPAGWSGASSNTMILVTTGIAATGNILVTASNSCGISPTSVLTVTVFPSPTITVNNGSICIGQSFTIIPSGANTYTFQGGSSVVSPTANATYTITGTSIFGCLSAAPTTASITVNSLPLVNATTNNSLICIGQTANLTATGANSYTWNPGGVGTSIAVSPTTTTSYSVIGTDINGCANTSAITQSVSACTGLSEINMNEEIKIYPNPFKSKITIETITKNQLILIYSAVDNLVFSSETNYKKTEIDLTELRDGIYFIRIGTSVRKIIKE